MRVDNQLLQQITRVESNPSVKLRNSCGVIASTMFVEQEPSPGCAAIILVCQSGEREKRALHNSASARFPQERGNTVDSLGTALEYSHLPYNRMGPDRTGTLRYSPNRTFRAQEEPADRRHCALLGLRSA
jgi:hypothetical protein